MPLNSFKDVQNFFDNFVATNGIAIDNAVHAAFWQSSYDDFVHGNVPNVSDALGNPVPILVCGDSSKSNLITILKGGLPGVASRMPEGGPYVSDDLIQEVAQWIDKGCPE